jgi:hypothetical protein
MLRALALAVVAVALAASPAAAKQLDLTTAQTVAGAFAGDCGACEDQVTECARVTPDDRIDCVFAEQECDGVVAVKLNRNGYLYFDLYACRPGQPPTAAAQVQADPPGGLHYEPLTPAAFEFPSDVYPKNLPYPAYPVRHYSGRTSQAHEPVSIWITRRHTVLNGSGIGFSAACWHDIQFLRIGGIRVSWHAGTITGQRTRASDGDVAYRLKARLDAHRRTIAGSFSLLHLSCVKTPIGFSAKLVGKPGF